MNDDVDDRIRSLGRSGTGSWIVDPGMNVKLTLSTDVKDDVEDRMRSLAGSGTGCSLTA